MGFMVLLQDLKAKEEDMSSMIGDPKVARKQDAVVFAALKAFLNGQKELRHQLIGLVIGLITLTEFNQYQLNSSEYQRRIIQIIVQRIFDAIGPK